MIPVEVEWVNQVADCIRPEALGGEYIEDRWQGSHFILGVRVERPKPWHECCRNGGIRYVADEILEGPFNSGLEGDHVEFPYGSQSKDETLLTLKLPSPNEQTRFRITLTCTPD